MRKIFTALAMLIFFQSCASTHEGNLANSIGGDNNQSVKVSAQTIERDKDSAFELVEVTFENNDSDWFRVSSAKILTGDPSVTKINVVVGEDLKSWAEAMDFKYRKESYNTAVAITAAQAATAAAMAAGTSTNNKNLQTAGAVGYIASIGWAASEVISAAKRQAISSRGTPESHLYEPFTVPPSLFIRRWVLLSKPVGLNLQKLVIEINTIDGKKAFYAVML